MTLAKCTAAAAVLTLALGATSALASPQGDCAEQGQKVNTALAANQQSPQYQDALKEAHNGRDFCLNGYYKVGLTHYANALKMLGVSAT